MYYSVKTEISLEDLTEVLREEGDECKDVVAPELNVIRKQLTKHVITEGINDVRVGEVLLNDVSKIVPSIDWVANDAYLVLTFYLGISNPTVSASVTCLIKGDGQKRVKSIVLLESLCAHTEIHFVEE